MAAAPTEKKKVKTLEEAENLRRLTLAAECDALHYCGCDCWSRRDLYVLMSFDQEEVTNANSHHIPCRMYANFSNDHNLAI
jgi:hypothetical protein